MNGRFCMEEGEDYDSEADELIDAPEYKLRDDASLDGMIHHIREYTPSWTDALNKPKLRIEINCKLQRDPLKVTGILLHELAHYYCWHCGYDFEDSSRFFDDLTAKLGLPSNYRNRRFDKDRGEWEDTFDYSAMEQHYKRFKLAEKQK